MLSSHEGSLLQNNTTTKTQRTRHPWDVLDLVAALYVGTYFDTERGSVLGAFVEASRRWNGVLAENQRWPRSSCSSSRHEYCCCSVGKCTAWVVHVLETIEEEGLWVLPVSTSKSSSFFTLLVLPSPPLHLQIDGVSTSERQTSNLRTGGVIHRGDRGV